MEAKSNPHESKSGLPALKEIDDAIPARTSSQKELLKRLQPTFAPKGSRKGLKSVREQAPQRTDSQKELISQIKGEISPKTKQLGQIRKIDQQVRTPSQKDLLSMLHIHSHSGSIESKLKPVQMHPEPAGPTRELWVSLRPDLRNVQTQTAVGSVSFAGNPTLEELRESMAEQIPALPMDFRFLKSSKGCEVISQERESSVVASSFSLRIVITADFCAMSSPERAALPCLRPPPASPLSKRSVRLPCGEEVVLSLFDSKGAMVVRGWGKGRERFSVAVPASLAGLGPEAVLGRVQLEEKEDCTLRVAFG